MNFNLTDEQMMIQEMVRKFSELELKSLAGEMDKTREFKIEILKKLAQLNLLGIITPPEYGGVGMDTISFVIAVEEISKICASTGVILAVHNSLVQNPLIYFGNQEQKEKYLPLLARGEKIGAFALTEPKAGSDVASIETSAVLKGDNYILNGGKIFITNGIIADIFIVFALTDKSKGVKGLSAFIVEKNTPGFSVGKHEDLMGIRASMNAPLTFEDCLIPKENLLSQEGQGFKIAMHTLDRGRIGIGAQALGIAQGALELAVKYSKERMQFGQTISSFQMVQEMLVEMAVEIQAARLLVYQAASLKDQGKPFVKESSMCKLYASETAMRCSNKALQIHGGYGYTKDYPIERYFRDAKITEIYEGTNEIQKLIIAKSLLE